MRKWRWLVAPVVVGAFFWTGGVRAAPPGSEKAVTVIVAEGTGKDEKEARAAAFREAVSRAVGTLVEAETLVQNDQIVKDQVLEFSGGFIKTYETLSVDQLADRRVRVKIRASVERLRLIARLAEAKVPVREVRGADLAAEKQTKDEARAGATELLTKLFEEIPKIAKAEVRGKPRLSPDGKGWLIEVAVSADDQAYAQFAKKTATLLDRISLAKDSVTLTSTKVAGHDGRFHYEAAGGTGPSNVFGKPKLGNDTPPGYAVWLTTGTGSTLHWTVYWVDADLRKSLLSFPGMPQVRVRLCDAGDEIVSEQLIDLSKASFGLGRLLKPWFLCHVAGRSFQANGSKRETASVFLAPIWSTLDADAYWPDYQHSMSFSKVVRLTQAEMQQVKKVTASVEFIR